MTEPSSEVELRLLVSPHRQDARGLGSPDEYVGGTSVDHMHLHGNLAHLWLESLERVAKLRLSQLHELLDPLCGSGTFLIEAAMIARRRAPSARRALAVERWPFLDQQAAAALADLRADALRHERKPPQPILGFDRDPRAIEASRANSRAAKVAQDVRLARGDATALPELNLSSGLLVSNPPYGERLRGGQQAMKNFYYALGRSFGRLEGWRLALLAGNPAFESAFHRRPTRRLELWNGPIECKLLQYESRPSGSR